MGKVEQSNGLGLGFNDASLSHGGVLGGERRVFRNMPRKKGLGGGGGGGGGVQGRGEKGFRGWEGVQWRVLRWNNLESTAVTLPSITPSPPSKPIPFSNSVIITLCL